jgi:hypothetical protein
VTEAITDKAKSAEMVTENEENEKPLFKEGLIKALAILFVFSIYFLIFLKILFLH